MAAPFGSFLSVFFFFPWLLLLLSSIFNFPIKQRVVLFLSLFLAGVPLSLWDLPPPASVGREGLGWDTWAPPLNSSIYSLDKYLLRSSCVSGLGTGPWTKRVSGLVVLPFEGGISERKTRMQTGA